MADQAKGTARPSRIGRIVLVVSLALNFAVAGVVIGSLVSGRASDGAPRSFDLGVGPMARALTQDERRDIARDLRSDRSLRGLNPRGRANRVIEALTADPFDPDALRSVIGETATRSAALQARAQEITVQKIIAMSPERRLEFAEQLKAEFRRGRSENTTRNGGANGPGRPAGSGG